MWLEAKVGNFWFFFFFFGFCLWRHQLPENGAKKIDVAIFLAAQFYSRKIIKSGINLAKSHVMTITYNEGFLRPFSFIYLDLQHTIVAGDRGGPCNPSYWEARIWGCKLVKCGPNVAHTLRAYPPSVGYASGHPKLLLQCVTKSTMRCQYTNLQTKFFYNFSTGF